jgi:putative transposase
MWSSLSKPISRQAWAHVVLFSSDLTLDYAGIIDYYRVRFQTCTERSRGIEFNFRDAKQYWGLEDFMNIQATAVTNSANLSLFMVNLSYWLLRQFRQKDATVNVLDLKAYYRGHKYVAETLKWLSQMPEPILMARVFDKVSRLGRFHSPPLPLTPRDFGEGIGQRQFEMSQSLRFRPHNSVHGPYHCREHQEV